MSALRIEIQLEHLSELKKVYTDLCNKVKQRRATNKEEKAILERELKDFTRTLRKVENNIRYIESEMKRNHIDLVANG